MTTVTFGAPKNLKTAKSKVSIKFVRRNCTSAIIYGRPME